MTPRVLEVPKGEARMNLGSSSRNDPSAYFLRWCTKNAVRWRKKFRLSAAALSVSSESWKVYGFNARQEHYVHINEPLQ